MRRPPSGRAARLDPTLAGPPVREGLLDPLAPLPQKPLGLRPLQSSHYSFSSRRSTVLYEFPPGTNLDTLSTAISVSSDGRWIVYAQTDQAGSNLVLVENFR